MAPEMFDIFIDAAGVKKEDVKNPLDLLKAALHSVFNRTKESQGIFGCNVMVSNELRGMYPGVLKTMAEVRHESKELEKRLNVLVTSAGDPMRVSEMVKGELGCKWFHVVPSVKHATRAVKAGVDGIIASGQEGGFHGPWEPISTLTLLPSVVEEFPDYPVVGCSGFCDGRSFAAALILGACGIQMGTRFLCTKESEFMQIWKDKIVETWDRGSIRTRGFVGPARFLRSPVTVEMARLTAERAPGTYTGIPDDLKTVPPSVMTQEKGSAPCLIRIMSTSSSPVENVYSV
jgi:enoyl-[acyl-carrier protein] reductase II